MSEVGQISDGFHTFDELYEHRSALFIALMRLKPFNSWYADEHEDGSMFSGYFIAGINLPDGTITYHMKINPWRGILEEPLSLSFGRLSRFQRAPHWDGHTPADVVTRLKDWMKTL